MTVAFRLQDDDQRPRSPNDNDQHRRAPDHRQARPIAHRADGRRRPEQASGRIAVGRRNGRGALLESPALRPGTPRLARSRPLHPLQGHATPFYYSLLAERGYFSTELLRVPHARGARSGATLDERGTGHRDVERVTGPGLSFAIGHAIAGRLDQRDFRCWVMMGDGELNEGQVWEAAMAVPTSASATASSPSSTATASRTTASPTPS